MGGAPGRSETTTPQSTRGLLRVLDQRRGPIVEAALESIRYGRSRYEAAEQAAVRRRVERLYDELLAAVSRRDLGGLVNYTRELAARRFQSGYDLVDVQSAINAVEQATWSDLCERLQPQELALSLGLVSTALGAAKDALAREYVSLALQTHAPSLDLRALFTGGAGA